MHKPINLIHLKFFCDTAIYQSVTEAARMNYVSQSAVSQAIAKLETIFGTRLFYQHKQKLQLTSEGKIVFEQAPKIFKLIQETCERINQTKAEVTGSFKFVTTKSLGMSFIAPLYQKITESLPHVDFSFSMGGPNLIRTHLQREEVDFAIVVYDDSFDQFAKRTLAQGRLRLYKSKEAPDGLIQQGIFVENLGGPYCYELRKFLEQLNPPLKIKKALAGWELTARFSELGIGVGFFPDYILSHNRYPNLVPFPLETPPFEYEICVIHNKGTKLSGAAEAFLKQFSIGL